MTDEGSVVFDVSAIARDVIRLHGADAWFKVSQLADQALEHGNMELRRALLKLLDEVNAQLNEGATTTVH